MGEWDSRVTQIAEWIPAGSSVLDVGAGDQVLKHLGKWSEYTSVDSITTGVDFDFDVEGEWSPDLGHYSHGVLSGLLEWVDDPTYVLTQLSQHCSKIVLSYATLDVHRDPLWRSNLSRVQLESVLRDLAPGPAPCPFRLVGSWLEQSLYLVEVGQEPHSPES